MSDGYQICLSNCLTYLLYAFFSHDIRLPISVSVYFQNVHNAQCLPIQPYICFTTKSLS